MSTMTTFKDAITTVLKEPFQAASAMFLDSDTSIDTMLEGITAEQASTIVPGAGNSLVQQVDHLIVSFTGHQRQLDNASMDDVDWGRSWQIESVTDEEWDAKKRELCDIIRDFSDKKDGDVAADEEGTISACTMAGVHMAFHIGQIQLLANLVRAQGRA